jgi:hypothetical protein
MKRLLAFLACILSATVFVGQAQSQVQLERFQRQLEQIQLDSRVQVDQSVPPEDRVLVDYGAYASTSFLSLDDPTGNTHQVNQYELVAYARVNLDGANEFFLRVHSLYNDFNSGDSFDGRSDFVNPRVERAYYRFDLSKSMAAYHGQVINGNATLEVGRQFITWGNGVSLSESIDGIDLTLEHGAINLDVLAGVTSDFVTDFDSSRPGFRNDTHRGFYGAMLGGRAGEQHFYSYGLLQRDYNPQIPLVSNGVSTRFGYNSFYLGVGVSGSITDNLLYGVEAVYEGGNTLSNSFDPTTLAQVAQERDRISAYALDSRADYVFADSRHSRAGAEVILASGDGDRLSTNTTLGGNRAGTPDHAFNSLGLLNTGLAFGPSVSNVAIIRLGASTFPMVNHNYFRQLQLGADLLFLNKLRQDAPIDEPTNVRNYLGTEADLYANWPIASDLTLSLRYGLFFPGSAIVSKETRNFIFTGLTYAF